MERPRRNVAPPGDKPYIGVPAPGAEVVPLRRYKAAPFPPNVGSEVPPRQRPPEPAAAREIVFTNLLRKAVENYYGNVAYYFRVLRANGLRGVEVYGDGDEVAMPARASS